MAAKTAQVEIYRDSRGLYRWRLRARNGEIVAAGESYRTIAGATRGYSAFVNAVMTARTVEVWQRPAKRATSAG